MTAYWFRKSQYYWCIYMCS